MKNMEIAQISSANLQGVMLLQSGRVKQAIKSFESGLRGLRTSLSSCPPPPEQQQDDEEASLSSSSSSRNTLILKETSVQNSSSPSDPESASFRFFGEAFVSYYCDEASSSPLSLETVNTLTVTLLYNMGFAFHVKGMNGERQKGVNFRKAIKLYRMAVQILENNAPGSLSMDCGKLYLATLNNLGVIHSFFFEIDDARGCLERISDFWDHNQGIFHTKGFTNIILTVVLYRGKEIIRTAPAA